MDHETREMFGNIIGLLEIMKKDIKVIKQDMLVLNSRQEVQVLMNRGIEESRQPSKASEGKKGYPMINDQLKMSWLK